MSSHIVRRTWSLRSIRQRRQFNEIASCSTKFEGNYVRIYLRTNGLNTFYDMCTTRAGYIRLIRYQRVAYVALTTSRFKIVQLAFSLFSIQTTIYSTCAYIRNTKNYVTHTLNYGIFSLISNRTLKRGCSNRSGTSHATTRATPLSNE